ncbi:triphosphoribosyl-dephospho-CoA synthase [Natronomonas sp. EA1]|uniref:triphosphoribosyl-dephospho-CoA synthase n=1 Tax=Natronomonas sp. EA1 TaxID=3421655 RepID=UPI003EBDD3C7
MRTHAENAELALLLEVAGTPKPGNVDRHRDHDDLRFEHFLAGAVGSARGLRLAEEGPVGEAFETAIEGMSEQEGGNTQFGCLLLLVPLVRAAARGGLSPAGVTEVVEATTVADAAGFYRAFEHVDVAVSDPPEELDALDVRRGSDAVPTLEARGLSLHDIMELSADRDDNGREWVRGFPRTFTAAAWILDDEGPAPDRAARAFLRLLAERPDTFVAIQRDRATAERASERAQAALDGDIAVEELADEFVAAGINPGTTADITAAALFVALERGLAV